MNAAQYCTNAIGCVWKFVIGKPSAFFQTLKEKSLKFGKVLHSTTIALWIFASPQGPAIDIRVYTHVVLPSHLQSPKSPTSCYIRHFDLSKLSTQWVHSELPHGIWYIFIEENCIQVSLCKVGVAVLEAMTSGFPGSSILPCPKFAFCRFNRAYRSLSRLWFQLSPSIWYCSSNTISSFINVFAKASGTRNWSDFLEFIYCKFRSSYSQQLRLQLIAWS